MNLVVETDNLVDGQPQRPKSLQKEASDNFDNMLLPTSRIMRAAREKIMRKRRNDPVSVITVNCTHVCAGVRSTLGFSVTASASCEGSKPSLVWPPRSVPQSCRLRGNRTQHLHRLQVASVASGLSQSVPLVSSMPISVDPSVSSTVFGLLYKQTYFSPCCAWQKQSIFFTCPLLSSMAPMSLTPNRVSISALQSHVPPLRASSSGCSSLRNPRPELHQDLSSLVTRRATSCASSSKKLNVCLLGIVFGGKQRIPASCLEEAPWDALTNIKFKTLGDIEACEPPVHTRSTNLEEYGWKHPNTEHHSEQQQMNIRKKHYSKSQNPGLVTLSEVSRVFKHVSQCCVDLICSVVVLIVHVWAVVG